MGELLKLMPLIESVLNATGMLVAYMDQNHHYRYVNNVYRDWFGVHPSECVGKHITDVIGEQSYNLVLPHIREAFKGIPQEFERNVPYRFGGDRRVLVKFIPRTNDDGVVQGIVVVSRDVSDLRQRETDSRILLETLGEGVVLQDAAGKVMSFNNAALDILGLTPGQLTGRTSMDPAWRSVYEDGTPFIGQNHPAMVALTTGKEVRNQVMGIHLPTGALKWIHISATAFDGREAVSEPLPGVPANRKVLAAFADITEVMNSKRAFVRLHHDLENALRRAQENFDLLSHIVDEAPVGIVTISESGVLTKVNAAFANSLGFQIRELFGRNILEQSISKDGPISKERLKEAFGSTRGIVEIEREFINKGGEPVHFKVRYCVVRSEGTGGAVILAVCENVSRQKRLEEALISARDMAISKSIARSQFIANVSHEIRTPLNGVLANLDLIASTPNLDGEIAGQVEDALQSGQTLMSLLNDILDYTKMDSGYLKIEAVPFNPGGLITTLFSGFERQCRERGLTAILTLDPGIPACLRGDMLRIKQILNNLLSNALKFTHQGSVKLEGSYAGGTLRVCVSDTGIGMDEEQLKKIFSAFVQADESTSRQYGGTGLGLSIVQHLVRLMNGDISVRSEKGRGSSFDVTIPLSVGDGSTPAAVIGQPDHANVASRPLKLLIAEDNAVNQKVLTRILTKCGHNVVVAANGAQAVEAARREHYDLIFMDCQMPQMDGYEVTSLIRLDSLNTATPIVAVTANAFSEDRDRCLAAGMNGYLTKPVTTAVIQQALNEFAK